jgi:hypothetical protein
MTPASAALPLLLVLAVLAPRAPAQQITIYRCTDASGAVAIQNMACPKGSRQQKRSVQTPAPPPPRPVPPAVASTAAAPIAAATAPQATAPGTGGAAPAGDTLYGCPGADGAMVVQHVPCGRLAPGAGSASPHAPSSPDAASEPAAPRLPPPPLFQCRNRDDAQYFTESEQAPQHCVPLRVTGLDGNPATGAGEACEVISDRCNRVADDAACAAWTQRMREAESHARFALPEHAAQRNAEYERLRRIVADSSCGAPDAPAQNP